MSQDEKHTIEKLKNVKHTFSFQPKEKTLIAWEAAEKEQYQRGPSWYITMLVIMGLAVVYGIFTGSWSTVVVFLLLPVAIILYANTTPRMIEIFITEKGIYIDKKFTPYTEMTEFWIYEDHPIKKFGFREKGFLQMEKEALLHDLSPDIIRNTLQKYIKEDKHKKEGLISHCIRILKL